MYTAGRTRTGDIRDGIEVTVTLHCCFFPDLQAKKNENGPYPRVYASFTTPAVRLEAGFEPARSFERGAFDEVTVFCTIAFWRPEPDLHRRSCGYGIRRPAVFTDGTYRQTDKSAAGKIK